MSIIVFIHTNSHQATNLKKMHSIFKKSIAIKVLIIKIGKNQHG